MPLQKCTNKGKTGTKYGKQGKCYTGKQGKAKAIKQMRAIKSSQAKKK